MARTIVERFGTGATLTSGVLSVNITNLTGLNTTTATADQIFAAIILHNKATQPSNAADDVTNGVSIDDPYKGFARNDTQIDHAYTVHLYESAGSIGALDPDDVVS